MLFGPQAQSTPLAALVFTVSFHTSLQPVPPLHSRERLGKRLGKRLMAGVCFLMACAALCGRHCGVCSAANAMAHASGLWAWRVLALAWRVLALAWQVLSTWQVRWQELVRRPRGHAMREFFEFK